VQGFEFGGFSNPVFPAPFLASVFLPILAHPNRLPSYCIFSRGMILSKDYNFGGGNMDGLTTISIFFGGIGIFFIGIGVLWGISIWAKQKEKK
jgi:hypothetical protein